MRTHVLRAMFCRVGTRQRERRKGVVTRATRLWRGLALAAVMCMALGVAPPAGAQTGPTEPQAPEVLFVPPVAVVNPIRPEVAYVVGVYRCFGGDPIHLWVSAKQGGPDPSAAGSGATSVAWYDTNVLEPPPVVCDGTWRIAFVPIGKYPNKAGLTSGQAWVQFCLVDPSGIVASQSKYVTVAGA